MTDVYQPAPTTGAAQPHTQYTYYPTGDLLSETDPDGNVTTYHRDYLGRVTSVDTPTGTSYNQYDANGNVTQATDRNGKAIFYTYDALNEKTKEQWFDGPGLKRTLYYGYDLAGNLTSASDPDAAYSFSYNNLDQQTSVTTTQPFLSSSVTLASGYDNNGNRNSLTATIGTTADFVNNYVYDALNRMTQVTQQSQSASGHNDVAFKEVGMVYNTANQLTAINRFNTSTSNSASSSGSLAYSTYGYDQAGRLNTLNQTSNHAGTGQINESWAYDGANRVKSYTNSADGIDGGEGSGIGGGDQTVYYHYDKDNRLTLTGGAGVNDFYAYDPNGNRTQTNSATSTIISGNRLTDDGTYTYQYDNEGNQIQRTNKASGEVRTMSYDNRNRLVEVIDRLPGEDNPVLDVYYGYDVFDRRVSRSVVSNIDGGEGNDTTTSAESYVYDGDHVVLSFLTQDGSQPALKNRFLYGPAVDELLAQEDATLSLSDPRRVLYAIGDNEQSTRDVLDNTGALVSHYQYDAFGNILAGDTSLGRYFFTGRELDAATGLQYNRERSYESTTGRFTSQDPSGLASGTNPYEYGNDSPTNYTDPSGLAGEPTIGDRVRAAGGRLNLTREQLADLYSQLGIAAISPSQERVLDNGCIGIAAIAQAQNRKEGPYVDWPEEAPNTTCFLDKATADAWAKAGGERSVVFAKQGKWRNGAAPTPAADGSVPNNSVTGTNFENDFNYVTQVGSLYWWMNEAKSVADAKGESQIVSIAIFWAADEHYPNQIWCVTLRP